MNKTRYLKGPCSNCGGNIEFPVELIGTVIACPHCGQNTELILATPPQEPTVSRKLILWTIAAAVILILGLAGSLIALKMAPGLLKRKKQAESLSTTPQVQPVPGSAAATTPSNTPPAQNDLAAQADFQASAVTLEKTDGTSLVYAKGKLSNLLDHQRFGVRVELDLFDAGGQKIGTTKDYTQVIEPKAEWAFKALVVTPNAASAKIAALREDQ
jgi:hypothetical protein